MHLLCTFFFICLLAIIGGQETIVLASGPAGLEAFNNNTNHSNNSMQNQKIINWIQADRSPRTGLFYSFRITPEQKSLAYQKMGEANSVAGIIERVIVEEGLDIYDGAVGQIALTVAGGPENLKSAERPVEIFWQGELNQLHNIRAGYPQNGFLYNPEQPDVVPSELSARGQRGFIFRIINANGSYLSADPLDGKRELQGFPTWPAIHWEDWKPVAGENAWVVIASLQLYHQKHWAPQTAQYNQDLQSTEWQLAEEIARAALILQTEIGGIRMAPLGTYREGEDENSANQGSWWYNQISSENNISWYAALRMLYQISGDQKYLTAMNQIENYFKQVWNQNGNYFYQGMNFKDNRWNPNDENFALDVQTWALSAFGPQKIEEWFGEGSSYRLWSQSKTFSGVFDEKQQLIGVGYSKENDRVSVEWTAGAVLAAREVANYYQLSHPDWSAEAARDAETMRVGIETLKKDVNDEQIAYSYSSKRGWIPFGWYSHSPEVLSLASTGWVFFIDRDFNPFYLPQGGFFQEVAMRAQEHRSTRTQISEQSN